MRVLVLGAGFGGLEATARLSDALGDGIDITLVDQAEGFTFGFSKIDVMFGDATPDAVLHRYADLAKPGVRFVQSTVRSIDPEHRRVRTDAGDFEADVLIVALGADLDAAATPGLVESGCEFYTRAGAVAARERLASFTGGNVVVGAASLPMKCPPAPSEAALLVHELLTQRGVRESSSVTLVLPVGRPVPPSPEASASLLAAFAERGISWIPETSVTSLDADRRVVALSDGRELPFDLYLGVPKHCAPPVVVEAGLTENGWIPVDRHTLETRFPGVYAIGDVTSVGTPKAGAFAEGQGAAVADAIIARHRGIAEHDDYVGTGFCYLRFGDLGLAEVHVSVTSAGTVGHLNGPSPGLLATRTDYTDERVRRWFG
jgi:sulfide:quinone oxidoreductase